MYTAFGENSRGETIEELAKSSDMIFIRSQDELSLYREGATGRQLSAWEALETFGPEVLEEVLFEGSAIIVISRDEPAATFKKRREALGLSIRNIADYLKLEERLISRIENSENRNKMRTLELVAQHLGLDERKITFQKGIAGDDTLALRLKDLSKTAASKTTKKLKPKTVISFNETAWVIATEARLRRWLNKKAEVSDTFYPSKEYGNAAHPAYEIGYDLAHKTREIIGLTQEEPVKNLRELCIGKLALPVVRCELPPHIAGATILNNESRGIVVNTTGKNENVWVQRATIAHELGHLLWDPEQNLLHIRVDDYDEMDDDWSNKQWHDYVEQRANAFAAEFLAPKVVAARMFRDKGLRSVMEEFGVSFYLARYQVWNGLYRTEPLESLSVDDTMPTADWTGRESYTTEWLPIKSVPISRRGFFAGLVVLAEKGNFISRDTAIEYLRCSEDEYNESKEVIVKLFS